MRPLSYNPYMDVFFEGSSGHPLADRRYDFALQLAGRGEWAGAADLLCQGLELAPLWPPLHFHLGEALRRSGENAESAKAFTNYLKLDPADNMGAQVKLVLLGEVEAPATLPSSYVRSLFDQYAPRFDKTLLDTLKYRTPAMLADMVPGTFHRLLDLGCGTGLAAAAFQGRYGYAEGVDLSTAMIDEARAKNLYNALYVASLEEYLNGAAGNFDLVLCADVFVYIGDLSDIFLKTARTMRQDGYFAFSVQETDRDAWVLGADHRYAHNKAYIEALAEQSGLSIVGMEHATLRQDAGVDVPGMLFMCRKN